MFREICRYLKSPMIPMLLVVLIDHMGFGILFPILVPVFMNDQGILGGEVASLTKSFWYNITLAIFPITLYFGAIFLGRLSDQFGRRKILMICLTGASLSYCLAGIAVDCKWLFLLIASRALAGLTSGSMPIAQAAVIDISSQENRARNLGLVITMGSLGFLMGPLVGGVFANNQILSWFSYATPFYVASLLALINLVFLFCFFKETFVPKQKRSLKWTHCFELIAAPLVVKRLRFLSGIFFLVQVGWSFYFQFIGVFLLKKHQFVSRDISLFMCLIGVGFAIGSTWAIRTLARYFSDINIALGFLLLALFCIFYTSLGTVGVFNWVSACLIGMSMAAVYSLIVKFFSLTVSGEEQGWVMGVSEAICSIAWAITPLLSTYLEDISLVLPFQVATGALVLSLFLLRLWKLPDSPKITLQQA